MTPDFDIAIVGAGLTGLTTALACASKGFTAALIDPNALEEGLAPNYDGRASALSASTFTMMQHLGVAAHLGDAVSPIFDILISDGEAGRAPSPLSLHFDASEIADDGITAPMGYMVENRHLRAALIAQVRAQAAITVLSPAQVTDCDTDIASTALTLNTGQTVTVRLAAACDGRHSAMRRMAGIAVKETPYKQSAIVTTIAHSAPHDHTAHELFLPSGPFAILPLSEQRCQIVWTDRDRAVSAAMALPEPMFLSELKRRLGDFLGDMTLASSRWSYPLSLLTADAITAPRLALIGDAAHAVHPIAGQGLNMGLRDAAALADVVFEARATGMDIGGGTTLDSYAEWRGFDNAGLIAATDMFNRLFSNRIAPLQHARRLGLSAVDKLPPVRQFFMREAAGLTGDLPSLLQP